MNVSKGSGFGKAIVLALLMLTAMFCSPEASAQRVAIKTNTLDYFVMSPNLSLEARLSRKLTLQLGVAVNPFDKKVFDCKLTNYRVEPELRYWFNRPMARHFIAVSALAGSCSLDLRGRNFVGDAVALGLSYGYALVLSDHWNMEAEIGLGVASFNGYHYNDPDPRPSERNFNRVLPVPVRFALSFAYIFK